MHRVGIVGGGIGGLATALALRRVGFEPIVFERSVDRTREGVALVVWANAMRALRALGVADAVSRRAMSIDVTEVRTAAGELLSELPIGTWSRPTEMPTVTIRRPELVDVLVAALEPQTVRTGRTFAAFDVVGAGVDVRFSDGSVEHVDALIGADGIHSSVRAQLLGPSAPRFSKQHAWVGSTRRTGVVRDHVATATVGQGPRFWMAPLADGAFWYATLNRSPDDRPARALLLDVFGTWNPTIRALIDETRDEDIIVTQICDRPPSDRWGDGRVTLLGDAAHASTPDLGQGACQAIESASVLARCLSRAATIDEGLRAYEQERMPRTATVSRLCWLTSVNSTIEAPMLCGLRDVAMRFALRSVARSHLEWILAGPPC